MKNNFIRFLAVVLAFSAAVWADMTVNVLNVGQGDAIYIELPNGKTALIDGGPKNAIIKDYFTSRGITKIDFVVLTHPHSDHYIGLNYVFDHMQVNNFIDTRMDNKDAAGDNSVREKAAREPGCTTTYPSPGDDLNWDPAVKIKVLNSCTTEASSAKPDELNNCSIVLRMTYNKNSMLFMGDAESQIELAMMRIFRTGLKSQFLKVGHHGSKYSSMDKFLSKVQPEKAYISVGATNVYDHPSDEAIQRLRAVNADIHMTSREGTLVYKVPGTNKSFMPVIDDVDEISDEQAETAVRQGETINRQADKTQQKLGAALENLNMN